MLSKLKSLFGAFSEPPSGASEADEELIYGLAAIVVGVINGRDQFPPDEMVPGMRNKLAEYLLRAVQKGSNIAIDLVMEIASMGVFDETDAVPCKELPPDRDVPGGVDSGGTVGSPTPLRMFVGPGKG